MQCSTRSQPAGVPLGCRQGAPLQRPVLEVGDPPVHRRKRGIREVGGAGDHPGHVLAHRLDGVVPGRPGDRGLAQHERDVGLPPARHLVEEALDDLADGDVADDPGIGRDRAPDPPPGGLDHGTVVVGLRGEVVEEQPARDPRLGRHLVERELLHRPVDELAQPDADELATPVLRRHPHPRRGCHAIEHCSTTL